jgi:RNA polymerase sigma-70 factor (ECF subfamily)
MKMNHDGVVEFLEPTGMSMAISRDGVSCEERQKPFLALDDLLAYQEGVFRICLGFSRNYTEAEDLAQDVYLRAFQNLNRLRNPSQVREWLLRIAKNTCLDRQKRDRGRERLLRQAAQSEVRAADAPSDPAADERLIRMKSAVRALPRKLSMVFVLRAYGHLSYEEIAAALRLRKGTVMSRLNRARRRLAAVLTEKTS